MSISKVVVICCTCYFTYLYIDLRKLTNRLLLALAISLYMSVRGYQKKSLSLSGAFSAVLVGFVTTMSNLSSTMCLLTFFVTSSVFTKWRSDRKRLLEDSFKEGGERNYKQVFCNGGVLVVVSLLFISEVGCGERLINFSGDFTAAVLLTSMIGALACCNGDTWSSEIGSVANWFQPRLITTFAKVPVGTNGGVTLVGLLASSFGGFAIGVAFLISVFLFSDVNNAETMWDSQWPVLLLSTFAGTMGSILDSYLGAIFQYSGYCSLRKKVVNLKYKTSEHITGWDILDNDQVNLLSSLIMSIVTPIVGYSLWRDISDESVFWRV